MHKSMIRPSFNNPPKLQWTMTMTKALSITNFWHRFGTSSTGLELRPHRKSIEQNLIETLVHFQHADILHVEISTEVCTCKLQWVFQQTTMIEQCFNFLSALPTAKGFACSIRIYLHWKKLFFGGFGNIVEVKWNEYMWWWYWMHVRECLP